MESFILVQISILESQDSSVSIVTMQRAGRPGEMEWDRRQEQHVLPISTASKPAVGLTQPP
jgi:hypothetical protein